MLDLDSRNKATEPNGELYFAWGAALKAEAR